MLTILWINPQECKNAPSDNRSSVFSSSVNGKDTDAEIKEADGRDVRRDKKDDDNDRRTRNEI